MISGERTTQNVHRQVIRRPDGSIRRRIITIKHPRLNSPIKVLSEYWKSDGTKCAHWTEAYTEVELQQLDELAKRNGKTGEDLDRAMAIIPNPLPPELDLDEVPLYIQLKEANNGDLLVQLMIGGTQVQENQP